MKRWSKTAWFVPDCWLGPRLQQKRRLKEERNEKNNRRDCPPDRRRQHGFGVGCVSDRRSAAGAAIQGCSVGSAVIPSGERSLRAACGLERIAAEASLAGQQQLRSLFPFPAAPALERCRKAIRDGSRSAPRYELYVAGGWERECASA